MCIRDRPSAASQLKTPKTSDLAGSGAGVLGGLGALFSLAGAFVSLKVNKKQPVMHS